MKCGEDDDGRSVRLRVWKYLDYLKHQTDDSPIYLFEGSFDEDKKCCRLLQEYTPPDLFQPSLFSVVKESRRPPYRWFLIGPKRSGTTVHIDPLGTSVRFEQ